MKHPVLEAGAADARAEVAKPRLRACDVRSPHLVYLMGADVRFSSNEGDFTSDAEAMRAFEEVRAMGEQE